MPQLRRLPLVVQDVEWIPQVVRTGGINGPLHDEWSVVFRLSSPEANVRTAVYVESDDTRIFDKETLRHAIQGFTLQLRFLPYDWSTSSLFWIGSRHGSGVRVHDPSLKTDLRAGIKATVSRGEVVETGKPVPLVVHAASGTTLGIVAVASSDTQEDRMRWRVRQTVDGPVSDHRYLNSGRAVGAESIGGSGGSE